MRERERGRERGREGEREREGRREGGREGAGGGKTLGSDEAWRHRGRHEMVSVWTDIQVLIMQFLTLRISNMHAHVMCSTYWLQAKLALVCLAGFLVAQG